MANITKSIRTKKQFAEDTASFAQSYGSTYSEFHSKIDSIMHDKELAEQIYQIIRQANRKETIKLTEEELAEYYGSTNKSQEGAVSTTSPREYGVFK